jgi:quercetin dioxygenase-like cupin family protein
LNMRNAITVSALVLASIVMNDVTAAQTSATQITITPTAAQNVITGCPKRFTGSVRVQSLFDPTEPSHTSGGAVTFQPGARSAWHTHPLGHILIVTDGVG